ncbi:neurofascin-like isoform X2 [Haliotis rubra]|uniref:neurofascin-like isoform X2 n=1 Tax=Haliotis rubra TaxID=36100 RepID=UPI001EE55AD9|nr:neurofascin-like isoform X2 [Haliotis rubra]
MLMKVLGLLPLAIITRAEGDGLSLPCRNPPYSKALLRWFKTGTKAEVIDLTRRVLIDRERTLHFAYVDVSDAGLYKCGAHYKDVIYLGSPVNVTVAGIRGDVHPSAPPTLASYSGTTTARLGEDVTLECIFTGSPIPGVTWWHRGRILTQHTNTENITAYLTILNVTTEDLGEYNCTGENEVGSSSAILHISIKSSSAALLVSSPIVGVIVIGGLLFWLLVRTRRRKVRKQDVHQYDEIDVMEIRAPEPEIYKVYE